MYVYDPGRFSQLVGEKTILFLSQHLPISQNNQTYGYVLSYLIIYSNPGCIELKYLKIINNVYVLNKIFNI